MTQTKYKPLAWNAKTISEKLISAVWVQDAWIQTVIFITTCKPTQIIGLTFTTLRSLAVTTIGDGCRFLNLCWFKNTNQSWMQTSCWCLYTFLTCNRASCLTHDVTRHHHRRVSSWVMWLRMLRATTSLPKKTFAFFIFYSAFLLNDQ